MRCSNTAVAALLGRNVTDAAAAKSSDPFARMSDPNGRREKPHSSFLFPSSDAPPSHQEPHHEEVLAKLQAQVWLTDMAHFQAFNTVWDNWVAPGQPPARACVEAPLALPDFKVEVMVIAAV